MGSKRVNYDEHGGRNLAFSRQVEGDSSLVIPESFESGEVPVPGSAETPARRHPASVLRVMALAVDFDAVDDEIVATFERDG